MKFDIFFTLCGPIWHKNSVNLTSKGHKGRKNDIRAMFLDWIFGFSRVWQWSSNMLKVHKRCLECQFWQSFEKWQLQNQKGSCESKISSNKKLMKIKFKASQPLSLFGFLSILSDNCFWLRVCTLFGSGVVISQNRLAFRALYKTSEHVGGPLFNL